MATPLREQHCKSLPKGSPAMPLEQAAGTLSQLHDDWELDRDTPALVRSFRFRDFYQTVAFVNAVAWIANREDHHPDLEVSYNRCVVHFTTHSVGGLSENDFICAARVDALEADNS
ncbi:MAG: 4a-hydroxytetrahydrobiopterin dehydratase [Gammaproteobacteria bacterium]|nr:4a-hydroxytetrahydrobiopterin dehydratase [Gammaproteobacteria bacterium]